MKSILHVLFCLLITISAASAASLKGYVYDQKTGEAVVGATVSIAGLDKVMLTGLDGSFEFKHPTAGKFSLTVSYVSYKTFTQEISILQEDNPLIKIYLTKTKDTDLNEVVIASKGDGSSEKTARRIEQQSAQLMNVVSGRAIETSPDLTVANVIQRVSGVSIERSSNGDGQYAILRGMDKRYNYTLVNGVKIPSPDGKYRYVPLDIFPAELLDRLEIYKSLTPNMEGDAVGGVVNMVMKDAPDRLQINANLAAGYNQLFFDRDFMSYKSSGINSLSPYEINGRTYQATPADFPKGTVDYKFSSPSPNVVGGISIGERFLNSKLGVLIAGSIQETFRGNNSTLYNSAVVSADNKFGTITNVAERKYSERQDRYGLHTKLDYVFNQNHKLSLYNMYTNLKSIQTRDAVSTDFSTGYNQAAGTAELSYSTRARLAQQKIYSGTLHGDHSFMTDRLKLQWSAVYSSALNDVPDNTTISLSGKRENFVDRRTVVKTNGTTRRWERNTDDDLAGYLDLSYHIPFANSSLDISGGGLYRDKQRSNFYNNYTLTPVSTTALYGIDFQNYTDINFLIQNPAGGVNNSLTYDASERIAAGYGMVKYKSSKTEFSGGLRIENTDQGYGMLFPAGETRPSGNQRYTDFLPSLNVKYELTAHQHLRASYFRSLNRPGFYELVPGGAVQEDYKERGNPDLKRALADNYDLRYEFFPKGSDQLMAGVFYKSIKNPIEYIFLADAIRGQDTYYTPGNFGNAVNYGLELDYIKFINSFGIKANYTYTHSRITTPKDVRIIDGAGNPQKIAIDQTRPLFGQSAHIGNLSLLYKNGSQGLDIQVAGSYTGPRINTVSQFVDNDLWQKGFVQMDASAEKRIKKNFSVFVKAGNILNTPSKLFIKGSNPTNSTVPGQSGSNNETLIRKDFYKQSYLLGLRYKM
jgi:outer membrane receptor protein involved in Fe transport